VAPAGSVRTFFKNHRHLRRLTIAGVVTVVLYTLLGFLLVPALARSIGQSKLSELLHRQVTIGEVRLNPFALSATVRGLRIRDQDGAADLFSLTEVYVNLGIASLYKGGVVVQQVSVVEPTINLVRTAEDRTNLSDILEGFASEPKTPSPPPSEGKPTRFSVSNIQLFNGHVTVDDRYKQTRHEVAGINLGIPFVSNFPYLVETFVQPAFAAVINGTQLAVVGRTKPFADSLESSITVELRKIDLPYYLAYVPLKLRMKLRSAVLDTKLNVTFVQYRDRPPRIDVGGDVALSAVDVVDDRDRPLLKLPSLDIAIASSDLLSNKLSLRHVILRSLAVHVRRDRHGLLQVQSLMAGPAEPADKAPAPAAPQASSQTKSGAPWLLEVEEVRLDDARIAFADESNQLPFATVLDPLSVKVKRFSTAPGSRADVTVAMKTDAHEQVTLEAKVGLDPLAFDGTLVLKDLSLPHLAPYYASQILFDVREGKLDLTIPVHVAKKGTTMDVTVTDLATELRGLELRKRGEREDFFRLPTLAVRATQFDLARRQVVLGEMSTGDARLRLERRGLGQPWNLETLFPTAPATPKSPEPRPAPAAPEAKGADQPFAVTVNRLDLKGWSARVEDRATSSPAVNIVDRIAVHVEDLATTQSKPGRVSLQARVNQAGTVGIQGALGLSPVQANLQVQIKAVPVIPVQPYFQDKTTLLLTSGQVGVEGRVALATTSKGPVVSYKGEISAGNFRAVSRNGGEELARLGELKVSGIDLVSEPLKVDIGEIAVRGYAANVVLKPDKAINLASIVPAETPTAPAPQAAPKPESPKAGHPAAPTAPPPVRIGALVLSDGTITFEDRSVSPAFSTSLSQFGGRISGLSFDESTRAVVALGGKLGSGPLAITGQVNPFAKKPVIDLTFALSDLDLSAMTPYSGKYAGYAVDRGQLYLDLKYQIEDRKLDAKNNVKISQFTFGQAVDSKDATKLPVRLAVSLLKDRHGVIQLDVPVSGSLDDPKFSVWGVVWTVVKNLLIKAATSPFALIGSLFGGGEELAWLEFEPGQFDVVPGARSKIESLAKAMFERPALRLEVEGHASPTLDTEALRSLQLKRKVAAQKAKEIVSAGGSVDGAVVVSPAEYPTYLKQAYRAEPGIPKPKNALGMLKDIPVADMERLMLGAIVVSNDDLRLLARRRAEVARAEILKKAKIETERVFLVEPRSIAPVHMDKVRDSRVDFRLQ
jgi:uncharacterized protein involved in outer membrane biogenesis